MLDAHTEECVQFLETHYREEVMALANEYPTRKHLEVAWRDLWINTDGVGDDLFSSPEDVLGWLSDAVEYVDLPVGVELDDVTVRVVDLPDEEKIPPGAARREEFGGQYVGVQGILERVTTTKQYPSTAHFECQRGNCLKRYDITQSPLQDELREPERCLVEGANNHRGPYNIVPSESEWTDYCKVRIDARPDTDAEGKITGYVTGDLIDAGGEDGLLGRVGEPVTIYGIARRKQQTGRNSSNLLFDAHLDVRAVEFERDEETIDIQEHKDEFTELAKKNNAVDLFAESIVPELYQTDAWDAAMEFAVAYLFGAPRVDIDNGPTYRGDLHFMIISDYSMGKSTFGSQVAAFSPNAINKSTTALSSGVGLTAAAVKDEFGEGAWTLKPGLLVRANNGHLILDEIDKGPDQLTDMNDALEGRQVVDVEKAGQSATYESRCGLLAMGNPIEGRFEPTQPVGQQLGLAESFLSRFDGIVTMEDIAEVEQDTAIAKHYGKAFTEALEAQYGELDESDMDQLDRPVPLKTGRAWIKHAREEVNPLLSYEQFQELEEWYAEEVRQLNHEFADNGEAEDMPVPATVRVLSAAVKMSLAFARVHLRDEVAQADVERAKSLGKRLVKNNWDGERFDAMRESGGESQTSRKRAVMNAIDRLDEPGWDEITEAVDGDPSQIEHEIEKLKQNGKILEPKRGVLRTA